MGHSGVPGVGYRFVRSEAVAGSASIHSNLN